MRRSILTLAILVAFPGLACAQSSREIAEGVFVSVVGGYNVGWVEFDDHALGIVPQGAAASVVTQIASLARKPIRIVVRTGLGAAIEMPAGVIELVPGDDLGDGESLAFGSSLKLGAGTQVAEVREIDPGLGVVVYLPASGVLFAGALAGQGTETGAPSAEVILTALDRLRRLEPRYVVAARGEIGGAETLDAKRSVLADVVSRVDALLSGDESEDEIVGTVSGAVSGTTPGFVRFVYRRRAGLVPPTQFIRALGLREGPSPTADSPGWTHPEKVVVLNFFGERAQQLRRVAPGVDLVIVNSTAEMQREVADADAILGWVTAPVIARAENLRWVQVASAGVERPLAIPGLVESEVVLTNAQRVASTALAEHAMGLALSLTRQLHRAAQLQGTAQWDRSLLAQPFGLLGQTSGNRELRGKTLLVAGLGGIGTEVARIAHGFGMRVLATRNSRREGPDFVEYVGLAYELGDLAREADYVINSLPLTEETRDTFDAALFEVMKPTAIFVNVGRGRTVDQAALIEALQTGQIAAAGLDVTVPEPLPSSSPLWSMPNVFITPHYAGDSSEGDDRLFIVFRENLRRFVNGEPLLSVVNKRRGY